MKLIEPKNNLVLENPNIRGEYAVLKLVDEKLIHFNFKYVIRCRSQTNYLFVFKFENIPIFVKKSYHELLEFTRVGCEKALI